MAVIGLNYTASSANAINKISSIPCKTCVQKC